MIASSSRRGLSVIGNEMVRRGDIPLFLCPCLAHHSEISRARSPIRRSQRSRSIASTSAAIIAIPHHDSPAHAASAIWREPPPPQAMKPFDSSSKSNSRRDEVVRQLSLIEETIDDIVKRPNHFQSGFEKVFMLLEARHDIEKLWDSKDASIRQRVQSIAPKLALEMVKLSKPEQSLKLLRIVSASWSKEEELKCRTLWRPAVRQMISSDLLTLAVNTIRVLCERNGLEDDWMSEKYLQVLLELVEKNNSIEVEDEVDKWWQAYERIGKPVPRFVTLLLLGSQLRRSRHENVKTTLHAMEGYSHHLDSDFWRQQLWPALRSKTLRGLFGAMIARTENISEVVEDIMGHYAKRDNLKECLRVLKRFNIPIRPQSTISADVVKPTMIIYGSVIDVLIRRNQADHAMRFIELARRQRCEGNYLHAYLRLNAALEKQKRYVDSFAIGIQLLNRPWQTSLPNHILPLQVIDYRFLRPNQALYSKLLYILSQTKDIDLVVSAARLLLLDILSWGEAFSDAIRHRLVLIVRQLGRGAPVVRLDSYLKRLFALDDEVDPQKRKEWDDFVQYFQKGGGIDEIKLIEYGKSPKAYTDAEQKGKNVLPSFALVKRQEVEKGYEAVVDSNSTNSSANVSKMDNDMLHENSGEIKAEATSASPPSPPSGAALLTKDLSAHLSSGAFALRIRVYAIIRRDLDGALAIFHHMIERGIRPTASHLGPLVEGLVLSGHITEAYHVKEETTSGLPGKKLSAVVYSALARGLGQIGEWKAVLSIANEMRDSNLKISRTLKELFDIAIKVVDERQARLQLQSPLEYRQAAEEQGSQEGGNLPEILPETYDIDSVFRRFGFFHHRRRYLLAQRQVDKALKKGLIADARLRKALDRSENLLRKQLATAQSTNRSSRRIHDLQNALTLCKENRARVKASSQDLDNLNAEYNLDAEKRQKMVDLIKDALTNDKLLEEAQQVKKKRLEQKKQSLQAL